MDSRSKSSVIYKSSNNRNNVDGYFNIDNQNNFKHGSKYSNPFNISPKYSSDDTSTSSSINVSSKIDKKWLETLKPSKRKRQYSKKDSSNDQSSLDSDDNNPFKYRWTSSKYSSDNSSTSSSINVLSKTDKKWLETLKPSNRKRQISLDFDDNNPFKYGWTFSKNSTFSSIKSISSLKKSSLSLPNDSKRTDELWSVNCRPLYTNSRSHKIRSHNICLKCSKKGHFSDECTRSGPTCILCGNDGHIDTHCERRMCFICLQINHTSDNCPFRAKFMRNACERCGHCGHTEKICPDVWRQYKYTTEVGPPVQETVSSQNKSIVYCANCAERGHPTNKCSYSLMSSQFIGPPPIVEIIEYDNVDIYSHSRLSYTTETHKPEKSLKNSTSIWQQLSKEYNTEYSHKRSLIHY